MTTAKQVGLASVAVGLAATGGTCLAWISLGSGSRFLWRSGAGSLILGGIVASLIAVVLLHWRRVQRGVQTISDQLHEMTRAGEFGLVMVDSTDELARLVRPVNKFLVAVNEQLDITERLIGVLTKRHAHEMLGGQVLRFTLFPIEQQRPDL